MKLKCHRPSLATAFQVSSGVVPTRTPKEILKNLKLEVAEGKATLVGTDQEVGIRYEIPGVETESVGEILLPTNRVIAILRELQEESVDLEVTDENVWIRAGHSEFRLAAIDPAEFPPVVGFDEGKYVTVPAQAFRRCIQRTLFATDAESTRYALGGVLLELAGETITLAATDSRRLAVVKTSCKYEGVEELENSKPVIPSKAMSLIERSVSDEDEEIHLAIHANDVLVRTKRATIYSRLVEGRFPRYSDVIPAKSRFSFDLLVEPFLLAVRQAQIVTNEESRGVDFQFADGMMTLSSTAADVGQSTIEMPISHMEEPLTITFDPRYVADFLRILEPGTTIKLELTDSETAAVLRTEDSYTYVIMPLARER